MRTAPELWLLPLACASCIPSFDDDLSIVHGARLLSIRSEPAEAKPGESVLLSALVASPDSTQSPPTVSFTLCTSRKPLTELGPVDPSCLLPPGAAPGAAMRLAEVSTVSAVLPKDGCQLFGPLRPADASGRPVDPDATGGYYQPVVAFVGAEQTGSIGAVRLTCPLPELSPEQTLAFNQSYRPNQNPDFASIRLVLANGTEDVIDGAAPLSVAVGSSVGLLAAWESCPATPACGNDRCEAGEDKLSCPADCTSPKGCSGAEHYVSFDAVRGSLVARRESLRVSWFASDGAFAAAVTGRDESELASDSANAWTAPATRGPVRFWLVLRDARGGQAFRSFAVDVR